MNNNNEHIINEELLTGFLLGETDAQQNEVVQKWLRQSAENRKVLRQLKTVLDMVALTEMDTDKEWQVFKNKIKPHAKEIKLNTPEIKLNTPQASFKYTYWAVAASVLIIIGTVLFYTVFNKPKQEVLMAEANEELVDVLLADGSHINLNRNSTLEYPKSFSDDKRKVKLKGEAFFKVAHDELKPFVVETEQFSVTVLGTEFFVSSFQNGPQQVYVQSGSVRCEHFESKEIVTLKAGEKYTFGQENKKPEIPSDNDLNQFAWKTAKLVFVNEKFNNIASFISSSYGCNIILKGNINECVLTVSFDKLELDGILNVIQTILDVHIVKKGKTIEISGSGC